MFGTFKKLSQTQRLKPEIPACRQGRWEDQEFRVILYIVNLRQASLGCMKLCLKHTPKKA